MTMPTSRRRLFVLLALSACLCTPAAFAAAPKSATGTTDHTPQRPVYLDIVPVADARHSMAPDDLVASWAGEALSEARQASIRMNGRDLPAGVRVLRVTYIVHEQTEDDGVTAAVAASTERLRTADGHDGAMRTFSLYNGLQQTLVQGPDLASAREQLRSGFKKELQAHIASAFQQPEVLQAR